MQRFVALSSSSHACALGVSLPPGPAQKKSTREGRGVSLLRAAQPGRRRSGQQQDDGKSDNAVNVVYPLIRCETVCVPCCRQGGNFGGGPPPRGNHVNSSGIKNSNGIRSEFLVRGALGNRTGGSDPADGHHHERHLQHRGLQRNHPQVVDSIRDFRAESWWTDDTDAGDEDEDESAQEALSAQLWTSQIILQLSLFWNLLGYSPSKVDEWLVSNEARRRLSSLNRRNRFSASASSSFPPALDTSFRGPFEGGDSDKSSTSVSSRLSQFGSAAVSSFRPRERLSHAIDGLHDLVYPHWLAEMSETYGVSFMMLVALGYALQGFRCFPWFAVGYMLKDGLQVDPGYMQFLLSSAALPMVLKPVYGIISDTVYIQGAHRVPYLAIAGVLQLISWGALAMSPYATSSAILFTAALTFGNLGAAIADVMNDALVAEVSKKQKGSAKGELQSFAWLIMASGGLIGNLVGGFALKNLELTSMYFIFLCLLGLHFVTCFFVDERHFGLAPPAKQAVARRAGSALDEDATPVGGVMRTRNLSQLGVGAAAASGMGEVKSSRKELQPSLLAQLQSQVALLGKLLKNKEISHTLLWFCASYAMVPVLGSSIFFYQTQVLQIDPTFIGFSRMVGQVGLMVGSQLYGGLLKGLPIRNLLGSVQVLLSIFMMSDLLLVKRVNVHFGIPDALYVMAVSGLVDCISQFKVLPVIVRLGQLCPPGSEGSLMAFFSSCHCLAGLCSGYFGVYLAQSLKISSHSFEGLPVGILIQAMFALLPILFIRLVPGEDTKAEKVLEKVQ